MEAFVLNNVAGKAAVGVAQVIVVAANETVFDAQAPFQLVVKSHAVTGHWVFHQTLLVMSPGYQLKTSKPRTVYQMWTNPQPH